MEEKSWPVAVITSSFALLVTLFFLLIPTLAAVVVTDQQVKQIINDQLAQQTEQRAKQSAGCDDLEEIIGQLFELQQMNNPNLIGDVSPLFAELSELGFKDSELSAATRVLRARIDPKFLQIDISGTRSLKLLLNSDDVQEAVNRVEAICSR